MGLAARANRLVDLAIGRLFLGRLHGDVGFGGHSARRLQLLGRAMWTGLRGHIACAAATTWDSLWFLDRQRLGDRIVGAYADCLFVGGLTATALALLDRHAATKQALAGKSPAGPPRSKRRQRDAKQRGDVSEQCGAGNEPSPERTPSGVPQQSHEVPLQAARIQDARNCTYLTPGKRATNGSASPAQHAFRDHVIGMGRLRTPTSLLRASQIHVEERRFAVGLKGTGRPPP
jgi:hypothetical protein